MEHEPVSRWRTHRRLGTHPQRCNFSRPSVRGRASAALRFRADQGHGSGDLTGLLLKLQQAGSKWRPAIGIVGIPAAIIRDVNRRAVLALRQPARASMTLVPLHPLLFPRLSSCPSGEASSFFSASRWLGGASARVRSSSLARESRLPFGLLI